MDNVIFNDVVMRDLPVRRPRTYRHRPSQLMDTYTEKEIHDRFRFCRRSIDFICDIVDEDLRRPTNRNHALSVEIQVLASLRFLASGSFYQVDFLRVVVSTKLGLMWLVLMNRQFVAL